MKATSIADMFLEASAALNAECEAATSRALAGIGRIRAGLEALEALEALDVASPVLPSDVTPTPALSQGEAATSRALAGLGRIRACHEALEALEALDVAPPVLHGRA